MELHTERLTLKPLSDCDRTDLIALLTNKAVTATFMVPDCHCEEDENRLFCSLREMSASDRHYLKGIYLADRLIGLILDVDISDDAIEIGWVIHPEHHNHGYATEAAKCMIQDLFCRGFTRVTAGAFAENAASFRVMEKLGMRKNSFEEDIQYRGSLHRCIYYEITR